MTAHKHAAVIAQFADLAQRMESPETWVEVGRGQKNSWTRHRKGEPVYWSDEFNYRITDPDAKRTITLTVNGREWVLPEPLSETPEHDQLVFYISDDGTVRACRWNNWAVLPTLYKEQRLHDTEADAKAWVEFDMWCRGGGV